MILYFSQIKETDSNKDDFIKRALSDYMLNMQIDFDANDMKIIRESNKKPYLDKYENIHFSISHSKDWWICGIQDTPLGIDLEIRDILTVDRNAKNPLAIALRFFNLLEQKFIEGDSFSTKEEQQDRFFKVWTSKEAYIKFLGGSVPTGLKKVSVIMVSDEKEELVIGNEDVFICDISSDLTVIPREKRIYCTYCSSSKYRLDKVVGLNSL